MISHKLSIAYGRSFADVYQLMIEKKKKVKRERRQKKRERKE